MLRGLWLEQQRVGDRLDEARRTMDFMHELRSLRPRDPEIELAHEEALKRLRRCITEAEAWGCL